MTSKAGNVETISSSWVSLRRLFRHCQCVKTQIVQLCFTKPTVKINKVLHYKNYLWKQSYVFNPSASKHNYTLHSPISEQNVSLCFSFQTIWWSSINGVMDRDQVVSCCSSLNNGISQRFNKTSHDSPHKLSLQNSPAYEHKHMHENKSFFFFTYLPSFRTHMTFCPPCNIKDDIFKHAEECCPFSSIKDAKVS